MGLFFLEAIAFNLLFICGSKADRADTFAALGFADRERKNISLCTDESEPAVSRFAVVLPDIFQDLYRVELGSACQPDTVFDQVGSVFRGIKLDVNA
jgi:hypothetical protein